MRRRWLEFHLRLCCISGACRGSAHGGADVLVGSSFRGVLVSLRVPVVAPDPAWGLTLVPAAGEAGGSFRSGSRPDRPYVPPGHAADPVRSGQEAAKRARRLLRQYCAANSITRLGTLTYGPPRCTDPVLLRQHVGAFFRDLRAGLGGDPFPYVWVPELHKDGVHFHVHFGVGRYVPRGKIEGAWGRGFVHIKRVSDMPVGSTTREEARRAAGYMSKYVSKSFDGAQGQGLHRYEVAQGFQPEKMRLVGDSRAEVLSKACDVMGAQWTDLWLSEDDEDWEAPPAVWAAWA
jgi:hypothetical protein